jgi:uncharacterized Zn-finger protein
MAAKVMGGQELQNLRTNSSDASHLVHLSHESASLHDVMSSKDLGCDQGGSTAEESSSMGTSSRDFPCPSCGKRFTRAYNLKVPFKQTFKRKNAHTLKCLWKGPNVNFICILLVSCCFLHTKSHMKTHTAERPYQCEYCPKAFARKQDCLRHMRIHTNGTENPKMQMMV